MLRLLFLLGLIFCVPSWGWAQTDVDPVPVIANPDLQVRNRPVVLRTEAYAAEPYGIGKVTFRLQPTDKMIDRVGAVLLTDFENRTLYPVTGHSPLKTFMQLITGPTETHPSDSHTIWFLFKGNTPLRLTLTGSDSVSFEVPVEQVRERKFERQFKSWWQAFIRNLSDQVEISDYPPMVETYLMSLVGKRMGLEVPDLFARKRDPLMQTFELMFDVESLRNDTIRQAMLTGVDQSPANLQLPPSIPWTPVVVDGLPENVQVEPIAASVPEECFYLRFGTWGNQLWLQTLLEEFGGNLSRMIQVRGFKYKVQSKFLNQLAIQSSEWDRLFGGNLINDVAVIGFDTYFDNGSAVGVLLQAKNENASRQLRNNLTNKRAKFVKGQAANGVTSRTIKVGDDSIELIISPDNRYRSFYAVSGNSHLMSTSLSLAKRFLAASKGDRSLANSDEFRFARVKRPLDNEDTVFIYLSTPFFQQLLTPQYQIELRRRNRIVTDMMLFELAHMAAFNEQYQDKTVEGLISGGYLPVGFRHRPDGGSFELNGNVWVDSIRGRRGYFAPIPDLPISDITLEESNWYSERANFFTQSIRSLDPMYVAIKRYEHRENVERVVFDATVAPFGEEKYGWLIRMLGPPLQQQVAADPNDIFRLQASLRGNSQSPNIRAHQVFAAVQDELNPNVDLRPTSLMRTLQALKEAPGYLGAWPSPGYTDWLPALGKEPDPFGYTYSRLLQIWKLQWNQFSVISFDRDRLERLKPQLRMVESERPAHIRLSVADLQGTRINPWANSMNYRRGWQTSIANVRLLNLLTQQFRIPPDQANEIVERMLNVELVCSLGGEYRLSPLGNGRSIWYSTGWPSFLDPQLPDGHLAPLLKWFRGCEVEVTKGETQFSVHGYLDIQRTETQSKLPSFDLFKGFGNMFGNNSKSDPKEDGKDDK